MRTRRLAAAALAAATALSVSLAGCGTDSSNDPSSAAATTTATDAKTTYTIGVAVIVAHPSLQLVQDGFEEVLKAEGIDYTLKSENAQGESANATTIASLFADDDSIDLILAISTPIALAIANAEKDRPILFSAVTDPVKAGLVPSWEKAGANITGTSDLNPEAKPVELITEVMPDAKTIGVIYSSAEENSLVQVQAFQAEAAALGVTIKPQAITAASELTAGLEALADVDAILIPTDNTVIAAMSTVVGFGREKQIPVFTADADSVKLGSVATRGISYKDLGKRTGEMAAAILKGEKQVSDIAPLAVTETELIVNPGAATEYGITLSDAFMAGATVVETEE
jgi:putative ABC transport system substrate-binding protein